MRISTVMCALGLMLLSGCATAARQSAGPAWTSEVQRPKWAVAGPIACDDKVARLFVGVAEKYKTEPEARDAAVQNAGKDITGYMGTKAKEKFERAAASFGQTTPAAASMEFQRQFTEEVVKHSKPAKWYLEKWNTPEGVGWNAFVLVSVPAETVKGAYGDLARANMEDARKRLRHAPDDQARKQAEDSVKFWEEMAKLSAAE